MGRSLNLSRLLTPRPERYQYGSPSLPDTGGRMRLSTTSRYNTGRRLLVIVQDGTLGVDTRQRGYKCSANNATDSRLWRWTRLYPDRGDKQLLLIPHNRLPDWISPVLVHHPHNNLCTAPAHAPNRTLPRPHH